MHIEILLLSPTPIPELSEEELESFFACPGLTTTFAGLEVFFITGCLAGSLFPTFFLLSSELESKKKKTQETFFKLIGFMCNLH